MEIFSRNFLLPPGYRKSARRKVLRAAASKPSCSLNVTASSAWIIYAAQATKPERAAEAPSGRPVKRGKECRRVPLRADVPQSRPEEIENKADFRLLFEFWDKFLISFA